MAALSRELKSLILISALVVCIGVAILLVLVLSEDAVVRVALIALILLLWPLGIWLNHRRKHKAAQAAADRVAEAQPATAQTVREYTQLATGAAQVADFLNRNRPGNDAVHSLPWYLLVGPPGSGKTSLLLSAGLSFHALEGQRRADQNLLRPTRDCDWRVTDEAVLIDTAGRYQTEGDDRHEWLGLIETLKKYRKRRPLDGLVIAVDAAHLLALPSAAEVQQRAQVLRARLNELIEQTTLRFPAYLVFTSADRLPGYDAFFRTLTPAERAQGWGVTFPLTQAERAHALFDPEFDQLFDALLHRRLEQLGTVATSQEQLGVFDFPLQFKSARQRLGEFASILFSPNPFSAPPLLRGIYFTACPAPQTPATPEGIRITSKGFFTEGLLSQVLLRDRHLAAALQATQSRPDRARKLMLAAAAFGGFCLLLLLGLLVSFFNNRALLTEGTLAGENVLRNLRSVSESKNVSNLTQIEADDLSRLQDMLIKLDGYDDSWSASLFHRFGLYTGGYLKPRLREIYFDFVSQRLLNPALNGLAQHLDETTPVPATDEIQAGNDAEQDYYDKLKVYLMVERHERAEKNFLQEQLDKFWKEGAASSERRHLAYYAEQASLSGDDDESVPRPQADPERLEHARDKLGKYAAKRQVYNEIMASIEKRGQPYFLRDVVQGQQGSLWFEDVRSSSVPYRFTKQAYYEHVKGEAIGELLGELRSKNQNDWVLKRTSDYQKVEPTNILTEYERGYVTAWQKFLDGLRVKKFDKRSDAIAALTSFAQPNSPFATIIEQVSTQTNLAEPPTSGGLLAWFKAWMTPKGVGNKYVEQAFAPLKSFKIDAYALKLKELRDTVQSGAKGEDWAQAAALKKNENYERVRRELRDMLNNLKGQPGSVAVASLLARPLDNIEQALGQGVTRDRNAAWASLVAAARELESRYPFNSSSATQVLPRDLTNYLDLLKQFFEQHLNDSFDQPGAQMKPLREDEFTTEFVDYLRKMFGVGDALIPGGQPLTYTLKVVAPSGQSAEMIVDGTSIKAESGSGEASPKWPSVSGQDVGVRVRAGQAGQMTEVKRYDGHWGIFKMVKSNGGAPPYRLNWGGIQATLQPPVNNPFQLDFTQLRAPRSIAR